MSQNSKVDLRDSENSAWRHICHAPHPGVAESCVWTCYAWWRRILHKCRTRACAALGCVLPDPLLCSKTVCRRRKWWRQKSSSIEKQRSLQKPWRWSPTHCSKETLWHLWCLWSLTFLRNCSEDSTQERTKMHLVMSCLHMMCEFALSRKHLRAHHAFEPIAPPLLELLQFSICLFLCATNLTGSNIFWIFHTIKSNKLANAEPVRFVGNYWTTIFVHFVFNRCFFLLLSLILYVLALQSRFRRADFLQKVIEFTQARYEPFTSTLSFIRSFFFFFFFEILPVLFSDADVCFCNVSGDASKNAPCNRKGHIWASLSVERQNRTDPWC